MMEERSNRPERLSAEKGDDLQAAMPPQVVITVPWSVATFREVKGILHSPSPPPRLSTETRDALLSAIAKARNWIDDLVQGRVGSFSEIAMRGGKVERHIRLLAPLAFVSPRLVSDIVEGVSLSDLTVTLPSAWHIPGPIMRTTVRQAHNLKVVGSNPTPATK
jgi:site-specific DNA recombinase